MKRVCCCSRGPSWSSAASSWSSTCPARQGKPGRWHCELRPRHAAASRACCAARRSVAQCLFTAAARLDAGEGKAAMSAGAAWQVPQARGCCGVLWRGLRSPWRNASECTLAGTRVSWNRRTPPEARTACAALLPGVAGCSAAPCSNSRRRRIGAAAAAPAAHTPAGHNAWSLFLCLFHSSVAGFSGVGTGSRVGRGVPAMLRGQCLRPTPPVHAGAHT